MSRYGQLDVQRSRRNVTTCMYSRRKCNRAAAVSRNNVLLVVNINKKLSCRRDRALLGVIENFAKSLKVIQNDTRANPCLIPFRGYSALNNGVTLTLKSTSRLKGHSRSLKLVPFESLGAVSIQTWQTDRRTDRQTYILSLHSPRYAYASRGKKWSRNLTWTWH